MYLVLPEPTEVTVTTYSRFELQTTQSRILLGNEKAFDQLQHAQGDHWIVISKLISGGVKVDVLDSVCSNAHRDRNINHQRNTEKLISKVN